MTASDIIIYLQLIWTFPVHEYDASCLISPHPFFIHHVCVNDVSASHGAEVSIRTRHEL